MKKKLLFILCSYFLFFSFSIGIAEERWSKIDGYKWAEMNECEKLGFLKGWSYAANEVITYMPLIIPIAKRDFKIGEEGRSENVDKHQEIIDGFSKEWGLELGGLTFGQMRDSIKMVYSDPRVKTWEIEKIMPFVRGRLKGGWTEKDLDEVIAYYIKLQEVFEELRKSKKVISVDEAEKAGLPVPKLLRALRKYRD